MPKKVWLTNPGHGGFFDGRYQTAPGKMYEHSAEEIFYEGTFNRIIERKLHQRLWDRDIMHIGVCHTDLDVSLDARSSIVNALHNEYNNAVLLDLHSNSAMGTGFEVFVHSESTTSPRYGNMLAEELKLRFPDITFREGQGELVKRGNFHMLRETHCPAMTVECLFYDNYDDYQKLINEDFQNNYVDALVNFIIKAELTL